MTLQFDYFTTPDRLAIRWGYAPAAAATVRGTVLFLNGRTEYMEKYAEVIGELGDRGFEVYTCDWRGQGLSGRMLADSQKGHVNDFEDYLVDLAQLVAMIQRRRAPRPFVLLGHSMGGHLGLRFLERQPGLFARAVLSAPMIDIQVPKYLPRRLLRWLVRRAVRQGLTGTYVIGSGGVKARDHRFEGNPLTSDRSRFQRNVDLIRRDPRLAVGGVTYGWLATALHSIDHVTAPAFARALTLPMLMVTASEDQIVCRRAQEQFCRQAPNCRLLTIAGARHELLVETDARRAQFWQSFDRFVAG